MKFSNSIVSLLLLATSVYAIAQDYTPKYRLLNTPDFYTEDLAVISYNVLDYHIDNTGQSDCTSEVQKLLDACAGVGTQSNTRGDYRNLTGGIVYFPAGKYLFTGQLTIPRGVTIRGDWNSPETGKASSGTVFVIKPTRGRGTVSPNYAFITMQPSTLVTNLTFWYPDQDATNIKKYPATILYGQQSYWGNDYCNVRHCTFINPYIAIQFNPQTGGGCPNIFDIYGTPLSEGIEMDCIADVGRFDGISFSARYWENSGLEGAPAKGTIDNWLYDNAIGIVMRRNDWSYTCNYECEGYNIGFHAEASPSSANTQGRPNGHNYGFILSSCKTGIQISSASGSGIMFTNVKIDGGKTGVSLSEGAQGPVQFYGCEIDGQSSAIDMSEAASSALMFQDCRINGLTDVKGGHFQATNCDFLKNIIVAPKARTIFTDNTLVEDASFINNSIFECAYDDNSGYLYPQLPEFDKSSMSVQQTRPGRAAIYVVTDSEFGAVPSTILENPFSLTDYAQAIQKALDKAASEGGGVVYIPSGHYRCGSPLHIPSGVELKGSGDIATVPKGNGAILEVTTGEGDEDGTPFINMERNSGLRGLTINYPAQDNPAAVKKYPYSVRANADCYIVNLGLRCAYRGIDLFTNKCDNHYVDYLAGHAFMNVARLGGNSVNGVFANTQCNTIVYACGDESKFGCWPNSEKMADSGLGLDLKAYGQNEEDLDFLIIGDCDNEFLYNNFLFGCNKGMLFQSDGAGGATNVRSLGNAVDGAVNTFVINSVGSDLDLVNSQIVALNHNDAAKKIKHSYLSAYFISTGAQLDKNVTFFSSNLWGGGDYLTDVSGGELTLSMANMNASGALHTCKVGEDASLNIINGRFNGVKKLVSTQNSDEKRTRIMSSVVDNTNGYANLDVFKEWKNNISASWNIENTENLESRTGWKATASNDASGLRIAKNGIDGVASTRWSTESSQNAGQWFRVDFNNNVELNHIILDAASSGDNDGPAGYEVEVFNDGSWHKVAEGSNGGATTVINFESTKGTAVRINQTGVKSNYWSIHEFYVGNISMSGIEEVFVNSNDLTLRIDNNYLECNQDPDIIEVYNLSGTLVLSGATSRLDVSTLQHGVYIAIARSGSKHYGLKFIK